MITTGNALGPAFGTFVGGLLIAQIGWRSLFVLFGVGSLFWLLPWHISTRHVSAHANLKPGELGPSFALILRRREIWGASLGQFCYAYAFYFVISWLPLYLVKARGLSVGQMAELGGLIYLVFAASTYSIGWLSDQWIRAGASVNRARKTLTISGHVIIAASLAAAAVGDLRVSVISLFCAGFAFGMATPNMWRVWRGTQRDSASWKRPSVSVNFGSCQKRWHRLHWRPELIESGTRSSRAHHLANSIYTATARRGLV